MDERTRVGKKRAAGRGQGGAATPAIEQAAANERLETKERSRQRRLGAMGVASGCGERADLDDVEKGADLIDHKYR